MEVKITRKRVSRAVAAVQSATAPIMSVSPLVTIAGSAAGRRKSCVIRFASFDALRRAQQKPDKHTLLRKELEEKLPRHSPRNDAVAIGDSAIELVLQFLGPVTKFAAEFAQTCRLVRRALLHVMNFDVAVLTPAMVSASALSQESVRRGLITFVAVRSAQVRTLVLHENSLSAVKREANDGTPVAGLTLPAPWVLQLISQLPYLTELDVRHVQLTESNHSQALRYLLGDLHLAAAGTLCTLKMDAELMRYWVPGWWRRLINLSSLVVGSRYRPPERTAGTTVSCASPTLLEMPVDYFTLMCEESRAWRLKLWVPLQAASLKQILMPPSGTIYAGVTELLVNMRCNEHMCEWPDAVPGYIPPLPSPAACTASATASEVSSETRSGSAPCKVSTGAAPGTEFGEAGTYPSLTTVTVVDVQERPEVAAEVYQAMLDRAPALVHFNVCDTVSAGTVSEAPKKRHGKG